MELLELLQEERGLRRREAGVEEGEEKRSGDQKIGGKSGIRGRRGRPEGKEESREEKNTSNEEAVQRNEVGGGRGGGVGGGRGGGVGGGRDTSGEEDEMSVQTGARRSKSATCCVM